MITCMGLVVGILTSARKQDVLNQCAKFLYTHKHLLSSCPQFEIDGKVYCTVLDYDEHNDTDFSVLFRLYDGFCGIGVN